MPAHSSFLSVTRLRGQLSGSGGRGCPAGRFELKRAGLTPRAASGPGPNRWTGGSPASIRGVVGVSPRSGGWSSAREAERASHEGRTTENGTGCSRTRQLFGRGAFSQLANSDRLLNPHEEPALVQVGAERDLSHITERSRRGHGQITPLAYLG